MTDSDLTEAYEERAAIMEFDGELPRHEAEKRAYAIWRAAFPKVAAPEAVQATVRRARAVKVKKS